MDVNLSNASLVFMSVTFATMCKSAAPIFLLLFAFAFRFKLIFGYLQLDNQLPLTLMPVLLAPEQSPDVQHPVFKMTITMQNENKDGIQVYPYVYIRVTEKCWRLDIHEPIIWAIVDFYNNLQLDRLPKSSTVTEVDPEIRFESPGNAFVEGDASSASYFLAGAAGGIITVVGCDTSSLQNHPAVIVPRLPAGLNLLSPVRRCQD